MLASLKAKLSLSFIFLNILTAFILSLSIYFLSFTMFLNDFKSHKLSIAKFISTYIDPDLHQKINSQKSTDEIFYKQYHKTIKNYYQSEKNIKYIYTLNYNKLLNTLEYAIDLNSRNNNSILINSTMFNIMATIENDSLVIDYNSEKYKSNFLIPVILEKGNDKLNLIFSENKKNINIFLGSTNIFEIDYGSILQLKYESNIINHSNREFSSSLNYKGINYPISIVYNQKIIKNIYPGKKYDDSNLDKLLNIIQSNQDYVDDEIFKDEDGSYLSAYAIIRDIAHNPIGIVVVEVYDKSITEFKNNFSILVSAFFLITILFSISVSLMIANFFTKPLELLIDAVETLGTGNLEALVDISSGDEFGRLAKSYNMMVSNLKIASEVQYNLITEISQLNDSLEQKVAQRTKTIQAQSLELEKQIQIAQKIQSSLLPEAIPDINNARVSFKYQPMMGVGGDFIDFYYKNEDELVLFICDVSGHGVPAAFLATMVKMTLQNCYDRMLRPSEALKKVQSTLKGKMSGHFISAVYCNIDLVSGVMRLSNAGHLPPILVSSEGELKMIQMKGRVISENFPVKVEEQIILLSPGDKFILYTDGVTEARNSSNEMLGEEKLHEIIHANFKNSTNDLCNNIYNSVLSFTGDVSGQFTDDITILAAEYLG